MQRLPLRDRSYTGSTCRVEPGGVRAVGAALGSFQSKIKSLKLFRSLMVDTLVCLKRKKPVLAISRGKNVRTASRFARTEFILVR